MLLQLAVAALTSHLQPIDWPGIKSPMPGQVRQMPSWMKSKGANHLFYKSAPYNWAIARIPGLARDMYGTGVGHAMAYEAMVTGKASTIETELHPKILRILMNPPSLPVDERALSPRFARTYGELEMVFDWAHTLHFQTIDALTHPGWTDARKDQELEALWKFYSAQPYALTGLPMNMEFLDSFPYRAQFRTRYPKVNALFWGYHWLQTTTYDMLYRTQLADQRAQYEVIGPQYREVELLKTDRDFMPMTAETSPRFAKRFPALANAFDNLHMLHDNVNDILASPGLSEAERQNQVRAAIIRVLASTHKGEQAGEGEPKTLHDHRSTDGMPGMGMMLGGDQEVMYMSGMGWMSMSDCAHCSVRLPDDEPWGATVSANGWTMTVRCIMCARDMASETPGRAIIRAATEDPNRLLVLISDEEGNWKSNLPGVTFLEQHGEHPECSLWSRAFTTRSAFLQFVQKNSAFRAAKPLELAEWAAMNRDTPRTYKRINRPNPYRISGGKS